MPLVPSDWPETSVPGTVPSLESLTKAKGKDLIHSSIYHKESTQCHAITKERGSLH